MSKRTRLGIPLLCLFLTTQALTCCTEKKGEKYIAPEDDSLAVTGLNYSTDDKMPENADALFEDFFFNFMSSERLQRQRILFPLTVNDNGKVTKIAEDKWVTDHFYANENQYTQILTEEKQRELINDLHISDAIVERIHLSQKRIEQFVFHRTDGIWKLTCINKLPLSSSPNASFLEFYGRFSTDSQTQMKSISSEATYECPNPEDDFDTMTGFFVPEQWPSLAPELPKETIYNTIYGKPVKDTDTRILLIQGIANGYEVELTFTRKNKDWKLLKLRT